MQISHGERLEIGRPVAASYYQPIANRPSRDFRVRKTWWIIGFNIALTVRG
jgi:hypothetical protein